MAIEQTAKRELTAAEREFRGVTIALELSADSIERQMAKLKQEHNEYIQTTDHIFDRLLGIKAG